MGELVELWFVALDSRSTEVLVGMCQPNVVIRPYRARQAAGPTEFATHDGVREWVASLDAGTRISVEPIAIHITDIDTAIVEVNVWLTTGDERTGGYTCSVWIFEDGRLLEATGYATLEDAQARAAALSH